MKFNSDFRPRLKGNKKKAFEYFTKDERRILVIGDIHAPFVLDGYLEFCQETYAKHNCNQVIFIGDILDNHYSSFHQTDPNGMGGGQELEHAITIVQEWYKAFPVADVLIGNHDRIIMRKAIDSDVPQQWIKSYNEVLGVNWNWTERIYMTVFSSFMEKGDRENKSKKRYDVHSTGAYTYPMLHGVASR